VLYLQKSLSGCVLKKQGQSKLQLQASINVALTAQGFSFVAVWAGLLLTSRISSNAARTNMQVRMTASLIELFVFRGSSAPEDDMFGS
jgi:hypothetical protein